MKIFFKVVFFVFIGCFTFKLFAQDFQKGVNYLANNYPEKALPIFFTETKKVNGNVKAHLYLAISCIQTQKYSDAIIWLKKGKELDATDKYLYSYNLGNAYYMQGAYDLAISAYQIAITENAYYAPAVLNKANAEMKLNNFENALLDYQQYLLLEPNSEQKASIQKMIDLLQLQKMEIEKKIAEENKKFEEAKRKQMLIDKITNDLTTSENAKSISAGSENTINYEEEGSLE